MKKHSANPLTKQKNAFINKLLKGGKKPAYGYKKNGGEGKTGRGC